MSKTLGSFVGWPLAAVAVAIVAMPASAQRVTATDALGEYARGRVLVVPRAGLPESELGKVVGAHGGKASAIGASGVFVVELPSQASETAIRQLLARHPHLKAAELDRRVSPSLAVNDPYFGSQWHTTKIGAPSAWDVTQGSTITVAILDTGVDGSHPDLSARMVPGWNFYDNNSNTADVHGHGTAVAGAAAATTNNGAGVAGVAGLAKIMPLRVADANAYAYWSTVAQAITYAADNGARVANISYVGLMTSSSIHSASQYMKSKGGLVVVSAGNNAKDEGYSQTTNLIPVSATTSSDTLASFSSYGDFVAVSAPGAGIWTTNRGGGYGSWNGTSFSSPVTAGTVALMMAANPGLSNTQVESLLFSTAVDLGTAGRDKYFGYGRVNAEAAVLAAAGAGTTPGDTTAPVASISAPLAGSTVSGLVAVDVAASDNVGVTKVELWVNGTLHATDTGSPFAFSWDSTKVANGGAYLQAIAYDAAGNKGTSSTVSLTVSNGTSTTDTTPPAASISAPMAGSTATGTVAVTVGASDNVAVTKVELWVNGTLNATDTLSPYSFNWDSTKTANGSAGLQAIAYDAAGNKGASATVTVQVSNNSTVGGGSLTFSGSSTSQGSTWSAIVRVTGAAAGTTISGAWNIGGTPSSCTADSAGACTITRTGIKKNVGSVTWTHGATGQKVTIAKP
jgi:hypothetical protein